MSITNAALAEGATISVTGGTAKTFAVSGAKISNGLQIIDTSVTDVRTRPLVNLQAFPSTFDPKTGWSVDKRVSKAVRPYVDASSIQRFPSIEIKQNLFADMTAAQRLELRKMAAQLLLDTDFDGFNETGSLV